MPHYSETFTQHELISYNKLKRATKNLHNAKVVAYRSTASGVDMPWMWLRVHRYRKICDAAYMEFNYTSDKKPVVF